MLSHITFILAKKQKISGLFWNIKRGEPIEAVSNEITRLQKIILPNGENNEPIKSDVIGSHDPLIDLIIQAVKDHQINLLMLCECEGEFAKAIKQALGREWQHYRQQQLHVLTPLQQVSAFDTIDFPEPLSPHKLFPMEINWGHEQWLLILVHLKSKQDHITQSARERNIELINGIYNIERRFFFRSQYPKLPDSVPVNELNRLLNLSRHHPNAPKTIIVGDFNMNPFDDLMMQTVYLNADRYYLYRKLVEDSNKKQNEPKKPFFYNPMWKFLSDTEPMQLVCGTYIWKNIFDLHPQMHLFDQVIFRSELKEAFQVKQLKIIDRIGNIPLILEHTPTNISRKTNDDLHLDHLPIIFEFQFIA